MKARGVLAITLFICWFGVSTAAAQYCCHHDYHDGDYRNCWRDCCRGNQAGRHCCDGAPSSEVTDVHTAAGAISEVVYLPGATPDSGMVEVRLQSAAQSQMIRLAPVGFLKQSGLALSEGDAVTVKGFPVAGMDGDFMVATEIHKGEKTLSLRDARGRPAW
jgi:hypothetical protein